MIIFENISKRYATGVEAVRDVSLEIEKGEFAFIVGPSRLRKVYSYENAFKRG